MGSTLEQIANKKNCDAQSANTGKKGCQIGFMTPMSVIALKRGTVIPKDTEFTKSYLDGLIASRTATPLVGAVAFEDQGAEDGVNTLTSGIERLNLLGLAKYMLTFQEGHEFYRELTNLTSYKRYDFIIFDDAGNMKIAVNSDGDYVGFTAGQVTAMATKAKVQGGEDESKSVTIQFTNRRQWDQDYVVVTNDNLNFDIEEDIAGVNSSTFSFNTIPSNSDTTLDVTLTLDSDMTTLVGGLDTPSQVTVEVNGTAVVVSSVVEGTTGVYTITIPALSSTDVVSIALNGVVTLAECMYDAGETTQVTIA